MAEKTAVNHFLKKDTSLPTFFVRKCLRLRSALKIKKHLLSNF